jgi:glycosyltransferase involved in cell wall biosynthesis
MTYQQFHSAIGAKGIGFVGPGDGVGQAAVLPLVTTVRCFGGKGIRGYYYAPRSQASRGESAIAQAEVVFIHGLFTHPGVWAASACRRHGVPYVVVLHGILDPWALRKTRLLKTLWLKLYGNRILSGAAAVVCATQREANKASPFLGRTAITSIINWACDPPPKIKDGMGRAALRRTLGFADSDRVLVFLGRLHSMKRPIETVQLLAGSGATNLKLIVIGPDDDVKGNDLETVAREMGWSGLKVVGPVFSNRKYEYLRAGDGFISLSHRENFNYSLAEAMAAGLPPILSPGNDLGWEFAEEGFSWQLKTSDYAESRQALDDFRSQSDDQLMRRGTAAREWAERYLGKGRLRQRLESLVRAANRSRK